MGDKKKINESKDIRKSTNCLSESDRGDKGVFEGGASWGEGSQGITPWGDKSILVEESKGMENGRRIKEQEGHRQYAKVNQRDRHDDNKHADNALQAQAGPKEHPYLKQSQRFDGIDPNLNPEPDIGTEARREYDNERREQEMEKQLRLGNMPAFRTAPENKPG